MKKQSKIKIKIYTSLTFQCERYILFRLDVKTLKVSNTNIKSLLFFSNGWHSGGEKPVIESNATLYSNLLQFVKESA